MGLAMNSTSPPPPRTSESSPHWFQQHCRYRFEGQHPHQLRSQLPACTAQIIQNLLFQRYHPIAQLDLPSSSALLDPNFVKFACIHSVVFLSAVFPSKAANNSRGVRS